MKILLAQINSTVGDLDGNTAQINDIIRRYTNLVDLIIFPELAVLGYPPQDLLLESTFIEKANQCLEEIIDTVGKSPIVLGSIRSEANELHNTAFVIKEKEIIGYQDKSLLPTYDVFDERRYFNHAKQIEPIPVIINGEIVHLGLQICEDLWDEEYELKVSQLLVEKGADILINISASPFHINRLNDRIDLIRRKAIEFRKPIFYCNLIGAQDELIFDGQSLAIDELGKVMAVGKAFEEDMIVFNTDRFTSLELSIQLEEEQIYKALTLGIKEYFNKTGYTKAIMGLSGGIDSALTTTIAVNALGADYVIGVSMPSQFSSDHSIRDAELLAQILGIRFEVISIKSINSEFLNSLDPIFSGSEPGIAEENLQARIRGNLLMAIANKKNALLLNTGNKTETALGYCTMYGDMCGALGVISDLNKTQVYAVSRWINDSYGKEIIPKGTLTKPPSAELSPDQVDPFDYDIVSPLIDAIVTDGKHSQALIDAGYDPTLAKEMMNKVRQVEYKRRQAAPGLRISSKAFGLGRRYPIVNKFRE